MNYLTMDEMQKKLHNYLNERKRNTQYAAPQTVDFTAGVDGPINADSHPNLYLSGPMTGYENWNSKLFTEVEVELTLRGFKVFNPAAKHRLPEPGTQPLSWSEYLRRDLTVLTRFGKDRPSAIVLLPGWHDSAGANLEVLVGQALGIDIVECESGLIVNGITAYHWLQEDGTTEGFNSERYTPPAKRASKGELVMYQGGRNGGKSVARAALALASVGSEDEAGLGREYYIDSEGVAYSDEARKLPIPSMSFNTGGPAREGAGYVTPSSAPVEEVNALKKAERLIYGDRNADYGHPLEDFSRSAQMWSAILGASVTPEQVGLCMIAVKISRECNRHTQDNIVDMAGYAGCIDRIIRRKEGKE